MATQKTYIKEKNLDSRNWIFLDMNDVNFCIYSHREAWGNVKNVHFSTFFQDRVLISN